MYAISVFGLGKVGLTLASCLAAAGHRVLGVDIDTARVAAINDGSISTNEPGVMDRLRAGKDRFFATTSVEMAVHSTDLSIIIVPTPSNTMGGFSLRFILSACEKIGQAIKTKNGGHVVSVMSTIFPGSSEGWIIPHLEQASGRKIGHGLGYCYNPSFIALGSIVQGIERTEYVLIGEANTEAGDLCLDALLPVVAPGTPVSRMSLISAEITKLASNAYDTMRVSFANQLMAACTEINAQVDPITEAMGHHIGTRFFKGAVPFGGPCWPRDNKAFALLLESIGFSAKIPRSIDQFNQEHGKYLFRKIAERAPSESVIGIIGLAYKSGTEFTEEAWSLDLIQSLINERYQVIAWDPLASPKIAGMRMAASGNECIKEAAMTILIQPLKELSQLDWSLAQTKTIVDCWRCLNTTQQALIGNYIALGQTPAPSWKPPHIFIA
ncbi:MAG: UDP-glucose 6-dehydrogenase [Parachlamydiales bacterium]|nr:UDP-glucose 6-dehydrogenase [Parachlamydiales bacterium]